MKEAGEQELFEFLKDIDARLDGENLRGKITLYVFGGAAAVIAYGSKRGTVDIDGYLDDERIWKKLVEWAGEGTPLSVTVATADGTVVATHDGVPAYHSTEPNGPGCSPTCSEGRF